MTHDAPAAAALALPPLWTGDDEPSPAGWRRRSAQIVDEFACTVYGRTPPGGRLAGLELLSAERGIWEGRADRLRHRAVLAGPLGSLEVRTLLHLPADATPSRPAPVVVALNFTGNDDSIDGGQARRWPYPDIVAAGFAVLTADYRGIEPDDPGSPDRGARALFRPDREAPWGALGAWSWGLSRLLDAAARIDRLDAGRSVVLGHSRLGKAALWAAAQDARFAVAVSNDSGCGGASLFRHRSGEDIAAITTAFPHWFTPSFAANAGGEDDLPLDQHLLLASIAPRAVYVASAEEDHWADPEGEQLAVAAARPAFELGGADGGALGSHVRPGGHDLTPEDWGASLRFARRCLERP